MNINISTTQWGDARQPVIRSAASRRPAPISRNLVMALTTVTLAGLMVIQVLAPSTVDNQAVVSDSSERSAEVMSAPERSAEVMSAEELLRVELNESKIAPSGGSSVLIK